MKSLILKSILFILVAFVGYKYSSNNKKNQQLNAKQVEQFKKQSNDISKAQQEFKAIDRETTAQAN